MCCLLILGCSSEKLTFWRSVLRFITLSPTTSNLWVTQDSTKRVIFDFFNKNVFEKINTFFKLYYTFFLNHGKMEDFSHILIGANLTSQTPSYLLTRLVQSTASKIPIKRQI